MKTLPRVIRKTPRNWTEAIGEQNKNPRPTKIYSDDIFVDRFSSCMKEKLSIKRDQGRDGWYNKDECTAEFLSDCLREHVEKGDPVDVANFCMMLHQRGDRILPAGDGK